MSCTRTRWAGVVLAALCVPGAAWGWGKEGHEVVGKIAHKHLSPTARQAIDELLQNHQYQSIGDGRLTNWADAIRGSSAFRQKYPNMAKWHFLDLDVAVDLGTVNPVAADQALNGDSVLGAVKKFQGVLKDPTKPVQERREALFFLVHLVGDLHQPLHCAERNNDKGGNLCRVHLPGDSHVTNLHKVWDSELIREDMDQITVADYATRLANLISLETKQAYQKGKAEDWILESHKLAREKTYAGVGGGGNGIPTLTNDYVDKGAEAVQQQLIKGGLRLAFLLNETFKDQ